MKSMEHPASLRCHDAATEGYFDYLYTQNLAVTFADDNALSVEAVGADDALPFVGSYVYGVRPSHRLHLTFGKESDASGGTWSRTASYEIVGEAAGWAYVAPCPTEAGLAQLRTYGIIE